MTIRFALGLCMCGRLDRQSVGEGEAADAGDGEAGALLLVRRIQEEGPYRTSAFRELVDQYTEMVFRRAYRLVASVEDAEEV
ncbi:MAG: hypothetical protein OXC19_03935, partial [Bryobacterales bacterium]|nr:hypothetical protein [Bryobacterales bacterium]